MTDAPGAKPENMVTNVTMTIYGVEAKAEPPWILKDNDCGHHTWDHNVCRTCGLNSSTGHINMQNEKLKCGHGLHDTRFDCLNCLQVTVNILNKQLSDERVTATNKEAMLRKLAEPASQPGESILCPQECLKFRMLGTCEHVAPEAKPEPPDSLAIRITEYFLEGETKTRIAHHAKAIEAILAEPASQPGEFNNYDVRPFSPLPKEQAKHVEHWLKSNEKSPADVKWSLYPIGMVQRWIERALEAEAQPGEFMSANEFWPIWLKGKGRMLCTKAPSEVSCMFAEAYHRAAHGGKK